MSVDRRRLRLDELLERALELPAEARAAFLSETCGDASERAEMEELLRLAASDDAELEERSGVAAWMDAALDALREEHAVIGRRYGAWSVVKELGRGGMGAVYLVERADREYRQQAALKLVPLEGDSPARRMRFEAERQILASLNHPNIARLLDGGRGEDGRPFLVMELVEGRPIGRYCDEERLGVEARLRLFGEVGRALEHAHRNLIVHRDVKPSNIVVASDGEVKLLDFGIAKLLGGAEGEGAGLTRPFLRLLTPEYASPEQFRGATITTASDVYQLGLLLFELLAGSAAQPVTSLDPAGLERAICERPVERPSARVRREGGAAAAARSSSSAALARRLEGDLDAIVLCATRKEPERRYASVTALLDDVDRHLRGLPVRARPESLRYRAAKFVRRHRAALAWAALVALVAAGGLAAWVRQRVRAAEEARRAADMERVFAQLFTFSDMAAFHETPPARLVLDQAAKLVRERLHDQPASQSRLLALLGRAYTATGFYAEGVAAFEGALATRPASDDGALADFLSEMARSEHFVGRFAAAESHLEQALALRRKLGGDPGRATLRELGDLAHSQGHLVKAERLLREALRGPDTVAEDDLPARAASDLANVLRDRGAFEEADRRYRESIARFRAAGFDDDRMAGTAVEPYYARLLILSGRLPEAESLLVPYVSRLDRLYPDGHPLQATGFRELGFLRLEQGRLDEAGATLDRARDVVVRWLGAEHPLMPRLLAHQAELLRRQGRAAEAAETARQALTLFDRLGLAGHPSAVDARRVLAELLLAEGRRAEAADQLRPALEVARAEFVQDDSRTRHITELLAVAEGGAAVAARP
jgi:eukaryotic-like serine/threonine-protein kinase